MNPPLNFSIQQKIPFGELVFHLSQEEIAILQLISCENEDALPHWIKLWENVSDYEDLLFSCKELMPSAVHKIQSCYDENTWKKYIPAQADFLAGLPRFTWTKNQYVINQYKKIASALEEANIEFIALKGVCEMLDGNTLALMRTSRDIDVLIHESDWEACKIVFENLGWKSAKKPVELFSISNPLKPHAETFYSEERIFDLDVHFSAIPGPKSISQKFTSEIWSRKVSSKSIPALYIPSIEDRFLITIGNATNLHNWKQGHTSKYIFDLLAISKMMDTKQLENARIYGTHEFNNGDMIAQYLTLVQTFRNKNISLANRIYLVKKEISNRSIIHIIRMQIIIQLIKIMLRREQIVHVVLYIITRILNKIYNRINAIMNPKTLKKANVQELYMPKQFSIHLFAK
jgi:hypothetical protein